MVRLSLLFLALLLPVCGQKLDLDDYLLRLKSAPGFTIGDKVKALDDIGVTLSGRGLRDLAIAAQKEAAAPSYAVPGPPYTIPPVPLSGNPQLRSSDGQNKFLGDLNSNPYDPKSVSNPYGQYGSPYSPNSVNNPYGQYGSPYSPYSANNPYTTQAPKIVTPGGKYLGKFGANPFDPDSVANPYGRHGSPYSPNSINNPYGSFGTFTPNFPTIPAPQRLRTPSLPTLPGFPDW